VQCCHLYYTRPYLSSKRAAVFCNIEWLPLSVKNCFGNSWRENGHNRLPEPPAIITGKIIQILIVVYYSFKRFNN
jgi:hypothetical protein